MATVRFNDAQIVALLSGPSGPVFGDLLRRTIRVQQKARQLAPVDEGRLRGSISYEMRASGQTLIGRVGSNLPYALYVHEGTGIYAGKGYITPKRARVLRWPVKNNTGVGRRRYRGGATDQYAYAKRVKGQPARPFLRNALDAAR